MLALAQQNESREFMQSGIVVLFALASFVGAFLLFAVQPMIGKMALPLFGGTPAVWNTSLVFFQGTLLCGYLFSYGLGRTGWSLRGRAGAVYLLGFFASLALGYFMQPIVLEPNSDRRSSSAGDPALVLLGVLLRSAALPLVLVSATAPLVQRSFALTGHRRADDPYFLYAASNAGSLLALLIYPFVIEPNLGLTAQSQLWKTGFLILAALLVACVLLARWLNRSRPVGNSPRVFGLHGAEGRFALAIWLRWLALVFIPSSWLLGVTAYLTTDMASVPLAWIIPLALYLLSFILAFARSAVAFVRLATKSLPFLIAPLVLVMSAGFVHVYWIPLHLITFFAGSVACHGALAQMRPETERLSLYYVTIALGGLLGGIWTAIAAPILFDRVVEYPLAIVLTCLAAPLTKIRDWGRSPRESLGDFVFAGVVFVLAASLATNQGGLGDSVLGALALVVASGLGILACMTAGQRPIRFALVVTAVLAAGALAPGVSGRLLHVERNFFGVVRVTHDAKFNANRLFHGSTLHGQQSLDPALRRQPSTYFTRSGPIGRMFRAMEQRLNQPGVRVAIVGLGAGTLASYAQPGQRWTFYEIDSAMERIAKDPRFFTYLRDSEADAVDIVLGDARQRLGDAPDHAYQLIVLDAFSSDAVPVHLLSREAIRLYRRKLANGGLLVFNLSNRYLDLDPLLGRQAADAELVCRIAYDLNVSEDEKRAGKQLSIWAVMAENESDLGILATDVRWQPPALRAHSSIWTDDYSDLASYLILTPGQKWRRDRASVVGPRRG
jgi:SAM-dependent methyltransferase